MHVTVDRDRCSGHARCASLVPEIYRLDAEGYAVAEEQPVPPGRERAAERGALACPEQAIVVRP